MKSIKQAIQESNNPAIGKIIPDMTFLRTVNCDCGEKVDVYDMEITIGPRKGERIEAKLGCKCEDIRIAKESMKTRGRLKLNKMQDVFDRHSLINKQLQKAKFANYNPGSDSQLKAKRTALRYVDIFDMDKPKNLLFYGSYGVGKSHLSKSIADEVIKKGFSAIFISVPKLLTKFRTSYSKDSNYTEGDLIEALNSADLLVLDDLGAEKQSEWAFEKLFEIIDSRQGMPTIYTSNYNPEALIGILGERNFSRVVNEDTTLIEIGGKNHRLSNFAKGG